MKIIMIGGGGHAKVLIDLLYSEKIHLSINAIKILDDGLQVGEYINGHPVIGKIGDCMKYKENSHYVIAIGDNKLRKKIVQQYQLPYLSLIHPLAVVGSDVHIGEGTVVMAGAVINTGSRIGKYCIINTGATVDHECEIGDFVHISPGVHLGGRVKIGAGSWMGIGCCVKNDICIERECVIGAGSVVIKDLKIKGIYVGVPAKLAVTNV